MSETEGKTTGRAAVKKAAASQALERGEAQSATDWLLSDNAEDAPLAEKNLVVNVGTQEAPVDLTWRIRAITPDDLRRIQDSQERESRRKKGRVSELSYHARIVAAASIDPPVQQLAKDQGASSASQYLLERFHHKPGLLPQMAGDILSLSGFDNEDVRDEDAVNEEMEAAGN